MMVAESLFPLCRHGAGRHVLHVVKWNPGGSSTPIVCVHALTRCAGDFERLAAAFSDRAVYAPEMAGRGKSPWLLDNALYITPHYKEDCLQVMDALNLEQVDWIGTSMGGLIGMAIAVDHPARIRKLVLNDVGPFLPHAALRRIGSYLGLAPRFADLDQAYRYVRTVYGGFGMTHDEDWRAFTARSMRQNRDGSFSVHYDPGIAAPFKNVPGDIDLWPVYDRITCPTLVLRGASSDVLLEKDAIAMTQRGPKARLVTFEGCGHAPALVEEGQLRVVREFLE